MSNEQKIEEKLGVSFKDKKLLHTALIHRSYVNESDEQMSNERFEFLGDAVLEFVVTARITEEFATLQEGELTALRSKLVNTISLAGIAQNLGLGESLYLSKGEESGGGRENPALLADTFEAVIGALHLDQGIEACEQIIERFILPNAQPALANLKDPKSALQELVQRQGNQVPRYKVLSEVGPDHAKTFIVGVYTNDNMISQGMGKSKQEAEQKAAEEALKKLS